MIMWIYDLPVGVATVVFGVVFIAANSLGIRFIRPKLRPFIDDLSDEDDLIGSVLSLYSVIFGLLLGTLAVITYQNLSDAQKSADGEAMALAVLYRDVSLYPEPQKTNLQAAVREYTRYVIEEAWPQQQSGIVPTGGIIRVDAIQNILADYEPVSNGQVAVHQVTLHQFNAFVVERRSRLNAVTSGIPAILWQTIILGSIVCIMLIWLFETTKRALHLMSGITALALGIMIGLIVMMDSPFRGEISVTSDTYKLVFGTLMEGKLNPP